MNTEMSLAKGYNWNIFTTEAANEKQMDCGLND